MTIARTALGPGVRWRFRDRPRMYRYELHRGDGPPLVMLATGPRAPLFAEETRAH